MTFFTNRDLNHLVVHATLHSFAWCFCGLFSAVFLLRVGLTLPEIFLAFALILVLRLALRPLVLVVVPMIGARSTLTLGTLLFALQFPMLALVRGFGPALVLYCAIAALGQVFYWTTYHAFFSMLGDQELRGSQVAERQVLAAVAGVLGPAIGGFMLAMLGPWPAFLTACAIEITAILPLRGVAELPIERTASKSIYAEAKIGIWLFVSDGWIINSAATAWSIVMFRALGARFDTFGGLLAVAALMGALSGMALGRFIDRGHARPLAFVNAVILAGSLIAEAICGQQPIPVVVVAICTTMLGGLYIPSLMTAIYNLAKVSACPLRFQFAAEGGWDAGGTIACLIAAAFCASGLPLSWVILLALPMVALQTRMLLICYPKSAPGLELGAAGEVRTGGAEGEARPAPAWATAVASTD